MAFKPPTGGQPGISDASGYDDDDTPIWDAASQRFVPGRQLRSDQSDTIALPLTDSVGFKVDATNPFGTKTRLQVENNQDTTETDINMRACTVNIGDTDPGVDPANGGLRLLQPTGRTTNMLKVYAPGNSTDACAYIGPNGQLSLLVGGLSSNALNVGTIGGANTFWIDEKGRLFLTEQAAPGAPAADTGVVFIRDDGAGKTQLCARFNSGAIKVLAQSGNNDRAGQYGMPQLPCAVTTLNPINRAYFTRFVAERDMTITKMAFGVSGNAASDDACDVGIYDATLTRLGSAGATTGHLNSTGVKEIPLSGSVALVGGRVYYAAFSMATPGGAAATVGALSISNGQFFGTLFGAEGSGAATVQPDAEMLFLSAGHPLGAGPITPTGQSNSNPLLALKE